MSWFKYSHFEAPTARKYMLLAFQTIGFSLHTLKLVHDTAYSFPNYPCVLLTWPFRRPSTQSVMSASASVWSPICVKTPASYSLHSRHPVAYATCHTTTPNRLSRYLRQAGKIHQWALQKSRNTGLLQAAFTSFDLYDHSTHRSENGIHYTAPQPSDERHAKTQRRPCARSRYASYNKRKSKNRSFSKINAFVEILF